MKRLLAILGAAGALTALVARSSTASVSLPVITEPATDGQIISPYDVHMVTGPFSGSPGENHVCSDWEIRTYYTDDLVWSASCVTGAGRVHVHLGDGTFTGPLAGQHQLVAGNQYRLRARFLGDAPPAGSDWSDWAVRVFVTSPATAILPLVLSDVSVIPAPTWRDGEGHDVVLPAAGSHPSKLSLDVFGAGTALSFSGSDGSSKAVSNPAGFSAHGALHVLVDGGSSGLALPASTVTFTDGSGLDRQVYLPGVTLAAGGAIGYWIAEGGGAFSDAVGGEPSAAPDFSTPVTEPPVPWAVKQPGFRVDRVVTGLSLPVDIAFVPAPGTKPDDPLFYVTELYGAVKMVDRSGEAADYVSGLLNFDPVGEFPGTGEKGVTGIVVDPASGDVFVSLIFAVAGTTDFHFPEVLRFHSENGGRRAASQTTILQFPDEPMGASHQISNLSIGPDGKLYVHLGDGLLTTPALDINSVRGKILRVNLDGSAPGDNPFYNESDGLTATDLIFAYGFRNPFGGAWREADGAQWEVENGPGTDRLARVVAGRNYRWDGSDASMRNYAAYLWSPAHAPVNIAFTQPSTFGGSGFPAEKMDHAFVSESGPTYAPGPQAAGKRISEFVLDTDGNVVTGPLPLVEYLGAGRGSTVGLTAGPDGLYFTDLYPDYGATSPSDPGASVYRVVWTGLADFTAERPAGSASLAVQFHDASQVPSATAWRWQFGDGEESSERQPLHVYRVAGTYDVRLTVTGSGGDAYRQKPGFVVVTPPGRELTRGLPPRPTPHAATPR